MSLDRYLSSASGAQIRGRFFHIVNERYAPHIADAGGSLEQGGRYNRPRDFAALYLGDSELICWQELARKAGGTDFLPASAVGSFDTRLDHVLDLTNEAVRAELEISLERLLDPLNYSYGQATAAAARRAGLEGILAPSVTGQGKVLAIFPDKLRPESRVQLQEVRVSEPPENRDTVS